MWRHLPDYKQSNDFKEAVAREREFYANQQMLENLTQPSDSKDKNDFLYRIGQEVKRESTQQRLFKEYWTKKRYLSDEKWSLEEEVERDRNAR